MKNKKLIPLGVTPKNIYSMRMKEELIVNGGMCPKQIKLDRAKDISGAIQRYAKENLPINIEWVQEYNEIINELGITLNTFTLS